MDNSVKRYQKRRAARLAEKQNAHYDSVSAYRQRRADRLQERFDANPRLAYGIAKSLGIKTEGMEPKEVWEAIRKKDPGAAAGAKGYGNRGPRGSATGKGYERSRETAESKARGGGYVGGWTPPAVKGMKTADVRKVLSACNKAGGAHYDRATQVAREKPTLRTFTTHGRDHIQQVVEKTNQAADVIERLQGNHRFQGAPIDRKLMLVSAWFHDTGMDGGEMDWSQDNGDGIRGNHGMNSALHILEHGAEIKKIGVNPSQAAFIAFAHTKSKSGVNDLMSPEDWKAGLDKMEKAVNEYNARNPKKKIEFDRASVFGGEPNEDNIHHMASQVAAVRLGDANREANIELRSQTGGAYKIDKMPKPEECTSKDAEIAAATISITDDGGRHDLDDDGDESLGVLPCESRGYSKMVVLGERNMVGVDAAFNEKHGTLQEDITLRNGNDVPYCTTEALLERCGEMNTINGIPRAIQIRMTGVKSSSDLSDNAVSAYNAMWRRIQKEVDKKTGKRKFGGIGSLILTCEDGSKLVFKQPKYTGENGGER